MKKKNRDNDVFHHYETHHHLEKIIVFPIIIKRLRNLSRHISFSFTQIGQSQLVTGSSMNILKRP